MSIQRLPQGQYLSILLAALEARDQETAAHSRRVAEMAERFCRCLNLPEEETQVIVSAAALHDIGKIGMPDSILYSICCFTYAERCEMHRHSEVGAQILRRIGRPEAEAEIVLWHHERWDGDGYPCGLKGAAIPFGARIIAICDSVDAMCGSRRYHPEMSEAHCTAELRRCSGSQFDPELVETFLHFWPHCAARQIETADHECS